jgi:hypothetical protein
MTWKIVVLIVLHLEIVMLKGKCWKRKILLFFVFFLQVCLIRSEHPSTKIESCEGLVSAFNSKNLFHFFHIWLGKKASKQYKGPLTCWALTSRLSNNLWSHKTSRIMWDSMLSSF